MHKIKDITSIIQSLPTKPGIYQYFNTEGIIIYIGKAKNLKKRVSSYFNNEHALSGKTQALVKNIAEIKFIITETELDALLLENNLIKKHQPKYNILLKDDKTYPWICIKNEAFPRVFPTRNLIKDGSLYFGPYANVKMMYALLDLIKQLFKLRNCNLNLSASNIQKNKFKVCLEYHIGNCSGPCESFQSNEDYQQTISQIREILKGNISGIIKHLKELMQNFAANYEFEKAQALKEKILSLENYQSKSAIVSPTINNVDVYSICSEDDIAYVNFLKVANGAVIQGHTIEMKKKLEESPVQLLELALIELRQRFNSLSREIIVPFELDIEIPGVLFTIPQRGEKKTLLELSERNARYFQLEKKKQTELVDPERHTKRIMEQMKKDLRLTEQPRHIECFDNSNIQGDYAVSACVVFKDGKPSKKDYRHFNVKTVEGPNDFATMQEVVYRRYKRVLDQNEMLPQLIVIDGGKGQLSSAISSLEKLELIGKVAVIGIAKKLEEIYYPGDSLPLYLDKKSETLKVIQHIRNEAHRFGITHHRSKRNKGTIKTELTEIKGISDQSAQKLLQHFKSVKEVKQASLDALSQIIGNSKALLVYKHFSN